jgi:TatD DNase family protein
VIDTHAHLDACADSPTELLARARAAGVTWVVTIGAGLESSRWALALAEREDGVWATVGVDPHRAAGPEATRVDELRELAASAQAVAVGEAGLDYHYGAATKGAQRRLLEEQLALADDLGKPIVIHCREAADDTADALTPFRGRVILHCFSEPALAATAVERGYYVSFAGNVTYPRNEELRQVARRIPAERLLAETDSPYLAPQPLRGRPNEPANVVHTLRALADARGDDPGSLAEQVTANATRAFALA